MRRHRISYVLAVEEAEEAEHMEEAEVTPAPSRLAVQLRYTATAAMGGDTAQAQEATHIAMRLPRGRTTSSTLAVEEAVASGHPTSRVRQVPMAPQVAS